MAKLEELMTPSELVAAIREGAVKDELVKKYKTSEQGLAMMLLPVYRRGEFTKEEFNDFFKGMPLKNKVETQAASVPDQESIHREEYDAPSEIFKSLSATTHEPDIDKPVRSDFGSVPRTPEATAAPDPTGIENLLEVILAKVTSIENRLSEIEKKITSR
jgi:hypothetical protein